MADRADKPKPAGKLGLVITVAVALLAVAALIWVPEYQINQDLAQDRLQPEDVPEQVDRYRRTWAQIFGGMAVLLGLYFTYRRIRSTERNVEIAREGQITERFTRAIEQLGDERLEVRLGGIYALERIARDSEKDHWAVMEVLTAFMRENAPVEGEEEEEIFPEKAAPDVRAALKVISRRNTAYDSERVLDMERVCIPRADLEGAEFNGARLVGAVLNNACLVNAKLNDADFFAARLYRAELFRAELNDASLNGAKLNKAILAETGLSGAKLVFANLSGAMLVSADLSGANLGGAELVGAHLRRADLTGANLDEADLTEANLTDASYELEQLAAARSVEGIKGLSDEELTELERLRQASDEDDQQSREEGDSQ